MRLFVHHVFLVKLHNFYKKCKISVTFIHFIDHRYWFGWIHTLSVIISFISIFITSISFNELEAKNPSSVVILAMESEGVPGTPIIDTGGVGSGKWL